MIKSVLLGILFFITVQAMYSQILEYTEADSLKVIHLLNEAKYKSPDENLQLFFARKLIGTPYVSGTLDRNKEEKLVVNLCEVDCTTYVEYITALSITVMRGKTSFQDFTDVLKQLRYRNGELNGYASRLHYFSDWIIDNEGKGFIRETTGCFSKDSLRLQLNYMTRYSDKYLPLKKNPRLTEAIDRAEKALYGINVPFLKKELLNNPEVIQQINEGDIVAITTNIEGLNIVHTGLAVRIDEQLYLLHASSQLGKVALTTEPLSLYLQNKATMTGIRTLRLNKKLSEESKPDR